VDDLSLFAQTLGGAQALLEAIQEFELWSGLKVNRKKTCAMVVERQGTGQRQIDETLVYMGRKERIFKRTEEARDLLRHHPLTPEQAIDLFTSIGVGAFRYSAALHQTCSPVGMEYLRPVGVMPQELCRHLQRCIKHEDVARQLTLRDLSLACEQWACESLRELTEEMEMWDWDSTLDNKWARVAKYRNARGH
jgi:hypothetical protein